jgi:quinoprotein glucose dehydrogenase
VNSTKNQLTKPIIVILVLAFILGHQACTQKEPVNKYWAIEDSAERARLPEYKMLTAAKTDELTPSNHIAPREDYRNWYRSHGDHYSSRYSGLTEINRSNVQQLEVAWVYNSGDNPANVQTNPIIVDGVMYAPTSGQQIVAVDATNGKELWRFDPKGRPAQRGIMYWHSPDGKHADRIIFTVGQQLVGLLAATGKPDPKFGVKGIIPIADQNAVPVCIYENIIMFPGLNRHVYGYDMNTGEQLWVFHTVPEEGEFGFDTWKESEPGASANSWGGTALDEARGILYVPTGSPKPNFMGHFNIGNNLFSNCLIAIDANNGKRLWHFQEVRHDIWDLDIPAPPVLTSIKKDGQSIDVVAQVTKSGNTLLLDRVSGKLIFPFRLKRAPTSSVPGMWTWPYQPDVELPERFSRNEFTLNDITNIAQENHDFILNKIQKDSATYGWMLPNEIGKPNVINNIHGGAEWTGASVDVATATLFVSSNELPWYITLNEEKEQVIDESKLPVTPGREIYLNNCVACHGVNREGTGEYPALLSLKGRMEKEGIDSLLQFGRKNMPAMPHIKGQELVDLKSYLLEMDQPERQTDKVEESRPHYTFDSGWIKLLDQEGYPGIKPPWGKLTAIDLNTGKIKWSVPLGEYEALTKRGIPVTGTENFGGPSVTAGGLVFCSGTRDLKIRAFDVASGAELWSYKLPFGGSAPPSIYEANGRQYIVVPATGGGKLDLPKGDAYVAFALPD